MKPTKLIIFLFLLISTAVSAQVVEQDATMSEGVKNAFVIDLANADAKMAENVWKNYIKSFGKSKKDRKTKEWRSESIIIPSVDPSASFMLIGKFEKLNNSSRAYVWLKNSEEYLTSAAYTSEARGIKVFLEDYALEVEKAVIQEELDGEAKVLKGLEKDLEKLIKKNEGYHKDIEKAKEAILKAENAIAQNLKDQEAKRQEIQGQQGVIGEVQEKLNSVGKN